MRVFDKVDQVVLERREIQLWVLAISLITILSVGVATLMYPAVFSHPVTVASDTARKCFFGFCTLMILAISYLADRQIVIAQLRGRLAEERGRVAAIRNQASADLVKSLPGMSHFQDRLSMEFRRSARTDEPLSTLVVAVKPAKQIADAEGITSTYGEAAKALLVKMRRGDTLYGFHAGIYGIILTESNTVTAVKVSDRFTKSLQEAQRAGGKFSFEVRVINHPGHVATAREMVQEVRLCLPRGASANPADETLDDPVMTSCAA